MNLTALLMWYFLFILQEEEESEDNFPVPSIIKIIRHTMENGSNNETTSFCRGKRTNGRYQQLHRRRNNALSSPHARLCANWARILEAISGKALDDMAS